MDNKIYGLGNEVIFQGVVFGKFTNTSSYETIFLIPDDIKQHCQVALPVMDGYGKIRRLDIVPSGNLVNHVLITPMNIQDNDNIDFIFNYIKYRIDSKL